MIFLVKWLAISIILAVVLISCLIVAFVVYFSQNYASKRVLGTQKILSDRDLLLTIGKEPDGMMTAQRLSEKTGLSKKEASARLHYFYSNSLLTSHYTGGLKNFYSLRETPEDTELIDTSGKPYLTVEDIILLFKHHDFRLTAQQIIMSTGLPLAVIKKELKYFSKEKVVELVYTTDPMGISVSAQTYLLKEPYRSSPEEFMAKEDAMNLELERIYVKEMNDLV